MDIHHDKSFRSILEDDSISLTSRAYIYFCSAKGVGLWLIIRPFIYLFHIAHFTFISTLHFVSIWFNFQHLVFFMCEYTHGLNTFDTDLTSCLFGGQQITTHDTTKNIMYAFAGESGHVVWRERWYAFTSWVSLLIIMGRNYGPQSLPSSKG
jgi:hypothetical protein